MPPTGDHTTPNSRPAEAGCFDRCDPIRAHRPAPPADARTPGAARSTSSPHNASQHHHPLPPRRHGPIRERRTAQRDPPSAILRTTEHPAPEPGRDEPDQRCTTVPYGGLLEPRTVRQSLASPRPPPQSRMLIPASTRRARKHLDPASEFLFLRQRTAARWNSVDCSVGTTSRGRDHRIRCPPDELPSQTRGDS